IRHHRRPPTRERGDCSTRPDGRQEARPHRLTAFSKASHRPRPMRPLVRDFAAAARPPAWGRTASRPDPNRNTRAPDPPATDGDAGAGRARRALSKNPPARAGMSANGSPPLVSHFGEGRPHPPPLLSRLPLELRSRQAETASTRERGGPP